MTADVIVLGLGGMGSAAAAALTRRGLSVLGLEQFTLGHDQGSSHGQTRIIRTAYFEHPNYVPLVRRAFGLWAKLQESRDLLLLEGCDCLSIGRADSELVRGVLSAASEHRLLIERCDATELRQRFPQFRFGDEYVGVLEQEAGFLYVDQCVRALQDEARDLGADLRAEEPVARWRADGRGVFVETSKGTYSAGRLVITAGPWAGRLISELGVPLTVMRQVPLWLAPPDLSPFRRDVFPIWIAEVPAGHFYGLPALDVRGHKTARHYGAPELKSPDEIDRTVTAADEEPVRQFLREHLPAGDGPVRHSSICIYTLTPDRHFLIDRHPRHENVFVAAGFSGHGFKFAPVVGEILADLAQTGRSIYPIDMFSFRRFLS